MGGRKFRCVAMVVVLGAVTLFSQTATAALTVTGSNVNAYFGSFNDLYQASDPIVPPWPAVGFGPYNTLTALPGVPAPPGGVKGAYLGKTFSPIGAFSSFADLKGDWSNTAIVGSVLSTGTVDDAFVAMQEVLTQNGLLPNYTYVQLNYEIDYLVSGSPQLGASVTRSFNVNGTVAQSGFVDFGGEMKFWDVTTSNTATLLGTLQFFYFNNTGGPYNTIVNGTGLINGPVPVGNTLRVTGDFFLIADPSEISVTSTPEPSSLALAGIAGLGLFAFRRRRRQNKPPTSGERMSCGKFRSLMLLVVALVATTFVTQSAVAQPLTVIASNVKTYFGSQSDAYQDSDPTGATWPAVGTGQSPYNTLTALPGVPAPPGGIAGTYNGNVFSPSPWLSNFNDGFGNTANTGIVGSAGTTQTVDDGQVNIFMSLNQTGAPVNYAYAQMNYEIDYQVAPGAILLGTTVTRGFMVSGNVDPAGFVDFGGEMKFWDVTSPSTATLLGTLQFFYYSGVGGPFATPVFSSGFINGLPAPDILRVTGDFFLIGDPSSIQVNSIPEPSSLALLGLGGVLALAYRRRRVSTKGTGLPSRLD